MGSKSGALQMFPLIPLSENDELTCRAAKNQGLCSWIGIDKLETHGNYTETRPKEAMFTNQKKWPWRDTLPKHEAEKWANSQAPFAPPPLVGNEACQMAHCVIRMQADSVVRGKMHRLFAEY